MSDMSMEEFLGHSTRDSGGGNYLENWKKRSPPHIDTFIHPKSRIIAVWQHPWPKLVTRKDKQTGVETVEVWSGTFNSHEPESVLRKQYQRESKVTDVQKMPPRVIEATMCPMSLMIEAVMAAIAEGRIGWCDELFHFVGSDPAKAKTLHAGGIYNAYGHKSVTDKQKAEIAASGIDMRVAWQQNMMAKCNYIFTIIDADHPGVGPQVTTETTLLGDKVKTVIKDEMTSSVCAADPQGMDGNPIVNPYCIRWVHQPDAKAFGDKYKALIMRKIGVDDEIQAAFDEDAPDVSYLARKGNVKKLRDSMEGAYVGPDGLLDFDAIFAPSESAYADNNTEATADEAEEVIAQAKAAKAGRTPEVGAPKASPEDESEPKPKTRRKRRTKKEIERDKREDEMLAMEDLSESDLIAVLDEEDHTEGFVVEMRTRLDAIQAEAPEEAPAEEAPAEEAPADDDYDPNEVVGCERCGGEMLMSDETCPKCGAKYDMQTGELLPEEEKPKPRSRSAAAKKGGESGDRITF